MVALFQCNQQENEQCTRNVFILSAALMVLFYAVARCVLLYY